MIYSPEGVRWDLVHSLPGTFRFTQPHHEEEISNTPDEFGIKLLFLSDPTEFNVHFYLKARFSGHQMELSLRNRKYRLDENNHWVWGDRVPGLSARDFFAALDRVLDDRPDIKVFKARWNMFSINHERYFRARKELGDLQAARHTWTGIAVNHWLRNRFDLPSKDLISYDPDEDLVEVLFIRQPR